MGELGSLLAGVGTMILAAAKLVEMFRSGKGDKEKKD